MKRSDQASALRRRTMLAILGACLAAVIVVSVAYATTDPFANGVNVGPKTAYPGPARFLTGVYAQENSCGCHTVGAGALFYGDTAFGTGSAFHSFGGSNNLTPYVANGTGTLTLNMSGHSDY